MMTMTLKVPTTIRMMIITTILKCVVTVIAGHIEMAFVADERFKIYSYLKCLNLFMENAWSVVCTLIFKVQYMTVVC